PISPEEKIFEKTLNFLKKLFKGDTSSKSPEIDELNENVIDAGEKYGQVGTDDKEKKLQELTELSEARKEKMIDLMKENPDLFKRYVIDVETRNKLPSNVQDNIEKRVTEEGIVNSLYADDFQNPENSREVYTLNEKNLYLDKKISLASGERLEIEGYEIGGNILAQIDDDAIPILNKTLKKKIDIPFGNQKMIVILMDWIDKKGVLHEGISKEEAYDSVFNQANAYYTENSYGKLGISGDVVGPYQTWTPCDPSGSIRLADKDVNFKNYDAIIIFYPYYLRENNICDFDGMATIGKTPILTDDGEVYLSYSINLRKELWTV
ncbi:MAG: hypothetical protein AABX84_02205, partial [Nanoarchaeota archaeon]